MVNKKRIAAITLAILMLVMEMFTMVSCDFKGNKKNSTDLSVQDSTNEPNEETTDSDSETEQAEDATDCAHNGGTATCNSKAICTSCGVEYGALDTRNHTGTAEWTHTEITHTKAYECCGTPVVATEDHKWSNGVCTECGYGCSHTGGTATCTSKAICTNCGHSYGEKNANNHTSTVEWKQTATTHTKAYECCGTPVVATEDHKWSNGVCTECGYSCSHTGGTATCTAKAVCVECGVEYGELNPNNHLCAETWSNTETTHTKTCRDCKTTLVATENHEWNDNECSECGYKNIDGWKHIFTVDDLKSISMDGKYFLETDLDLDGIEWKPIGTSSNNFTGIFDGNDHVISNFKITNSRQYTGLFGYNSGTIKNLGVEDFIVNVTDSTAKGHMYAGGLVGFNSGTITDCYSTGDVSVSVRNFSKSIYVGGLVGYNDGGVITACYATGKVIAASEYDDGNTYSCAGGLIGYNYANEGEATITNCYTTGEVKATSIYSWGSSYGYAGGLVGYNEGNYGDALITDCYAIGNVSATATCRYSDDLSISYAGGLVGCNEGDGDYGGYAIITNCYARGDVKATSSSGNSSADPHYSFSYAGGLVGRNVSYEGGVTIEKSYATGSVSATSNSNSKFSFAGALVGSNNGTITDCYATGNANATSNSSKAYAGALVGDNSGAITNSYATGNATAESMSGSAYAGGLVGYNDGTITNCYATGNISATGNSSYAGGLVGSAYGSYSEITNSYATGNVSSTGSDSNSWTGGLIGYNDLGKITNCHRYSEQTVLGDVENAFGSATSMENLQSETWVKNNLWYETQLWNFDIGYPTLNYKFIQNIEDAKVIEISTKEELLKLQGQRLILNYRLIANIDLGGIEWTPIYYFDGSFDGNGYVISNFKITGSMEYAALFGYNAGTIKNLGIEKFTINASYIDTVYAGGLVAINEEGTITACYSVGDINATASSEYIDVNGGGLVGYNKRGTITNSYATGDINIISSGRSNAGGLVGINEEGTITKCYSTGDVSATFSEVNRAGGLVGCNIRGTITNCYATGDINATSTFNSAYVGGLVGENDGNGGTATIMNCYATGSISATSNSSRAYAGGLVGYNNYGTITNSYATGNVSAESPSGSTCAGGLVGNNYNGRITNSYRYIEQTILGCTIDTNGEVKNIITLKSVIFHSSVLGWFDDDWNIVEGEHPILNNVGITN
ncbi:MAG: hypothetical protein E7642_02760 [Ruminococcaceae bacterium]|nr:hypothetical protein [Oscillospiraceae bacterium]